MRRSARRSARRRALFFLILLSLVALLLAVLFLKPDWMGRWMYPIHYKEDIRISAENYELDPLLIAAVIRVETNYTPDAVSGKGAVGIMQLMPDTAEWIMKKGGFTAVSPNMLTARADISIELGSWYLRSLHKQFDENLYAALAAYNAGPGTVKRWMSEGTWDGTFETVKEIPYGETRHYVQRVIYYYNKYQKYYTEF